MFLVVEQYNFCCPAYKKTANMPKFPSDYLPALEAVSAPVCVINTA